LKQWIDEHRPRCLVVDPLSAMLKSGGPVSALSVAQRLLYLTKERGITLVSTSLLAEDSPLQEASPLGISTIADTWIHLSYLVQGGERNRELTVVKSRGTGHSNQVRELVLSDDGINLVDVYTAGGEVLLGTLRWEKEMEEAQQRERQKAETERRLRELQLAEAETQARMEILRQELEARRAEIARLQEDGETRQENWEEWHRDVATLRGGGPSAAQDVLNQPRDSD
jgi:circadian clock protein KaiC